MYNRTLIEIKKRSPKVYSALKFIKNKYIFNPKYFKTKAYYNFELIKNILEETHLERNKKNYFKNDL